MTLPNWADLAQPATDGRIAVYSVEPDKAYPALLKELQPILQQRLQRSDIGTDEAVRLSHAVLGLPAKGDRPLIKTAADTPSAREDVVRNALERLKAPLVMDQYWLECLYQMMKMQMQLSVGKMHFEIRVRGADPDYKKRWKIADHPEGRGVEQASKGKEARELFRLMRGFIPS